MLDKMEIFRMAQGLAIHAAARQSMIAQNVANADTPGYRARDLAPFSESYRSAQPDLRATRPGHVMAGEAGVVNTAARDGLRPGALSPNGNNVSLEVEMLEAAEAKGKHDLALTVYQSALNIMRTSLGRR